MSTNLIPLHTIRQAFNELGALVIRVSRSQMGDAARLHEHQRECTSLINLAEQACFTYTFCLHDTDYASSI